MKKIILGCWQLGGAPSFRDIPESEARALLEYAYEAGIRSYDTAPIYGNGKSELFIGNGFKEQRKDIQIITKFGYNILRGQSQYDVSKEGIESQLHQSLERLQTDYIDTYLLHIPERIESISNIIGTLNDIQNRGLIRNYGLSNVQGALLQGFLNQKEHKISVIQDFYNIVDRSVENTIFPYLYEGIEFMAYSPFYRGGLTNISMVTLLEKGENGINQILKNQSLKDFMRQRKILEIIAERKGITLIDLALDFLLSKEEVQSIIFGTKNIHHLKDFLKRIHKFPV